MGTIISLIVGGIFCTFSLNDAMPFIFRYGWSFFFYLLGKKTRRIIQLRKIFTTNLLNYLGGLGVIWSLIWLIFASDTPTNNQHISDNEKEYIRACKAAEKIQDSRTVKQWKLFISHLAFTCL